MLPTLSSQLARALDPSESGSEGLGETALLDRFLDILAQIDLDGGHGVIDRLLAARVPADQILLGLLTPAAQRLGELWEDDARSFIDVTLATGRLQELLRWIAARAPTGGPAPAAPEVLLVTPEGEDHTFGALLFHAVLRIRGWSVVPVAPFWRDVERSLQNPRLAVLGVSVGTRRSLDRARSIIRRARTAAANRSLVVLAGGALVSVDPDAAAKLGADATAGDAESALDLLRTLVPRGLRPEIQG